MTTDATLRLTITIYLHPQRIHPDTIEGVTAPRVFFASKYWEHTHAEWKSDGQRDKLNQSQSWVQYGQSYRSEYYVRTSPMVCTVNRYGTCWEGLRAESLLGDNGVWKARLGDVEVGQENTS